ncbi:hypothetical protein [Halochromatium roseum]|uniref:hypothetical protein n=1 Tax=Halochromatium roseum TaxID=391920 RepID=UPI003B836984
MLRMLAIADGFLNPRSDGFRGAKTLWMGLQNYNGIRISCSCWRLSTASGRVMGKVWPF